VRRARHEAGRSLPPIHAHAFGSFVNGMSGRPRSSAQDQAPAISGRLCICVFRTCAGFAVGNRRRMTTLSSDGKARDALSTRQRRVQTRKEKASGTFESRRGFLGTGPPLRALCYAMRSGFPASRRARASRLDASADATDTWLTDQQEYDGHRYVKLDQSPEDVAALKEFCTFETESTARPVEPAAHTTALYLSLARRRRDRREELQTSLAS